MTLTIFLEDTITTLHKLCPLSLNLILIPIFDYQLEHIFVLDRIFFTQTLATTPCLFSSGLSRMVYEHFWGCLILEDPSSKFSKLFQVTVAITHGDILKLMALMLGVSKLLAIVKDIGGFRPIAVGEVFFRLISCSIVLQLRGLFQKHLSPHQFRILTPRGYVAILFNIQALLDLHLD